MWQIDAGHAMGKTDGWRSTFVLVHVRGSGVRFATYRDDNEGGAYTLCHEGELVSSSHGKPPVAHAGPKQSVVDRDGDGMATVTRDGSGSYAPEGTIRSYTWKQANKKLAAGKIAQVALPVGYFKDISLTVTDDRGAMDSDIARIWVKPKGFQNNPPIPDAGSDQTIRLSASAELNGVVTDDGVSIPPGKIKVTWFVESGPGAVKFGRRYAARTTARFSSAGTYALRLRARYADLHASDTMTVTVVDGT